VRRLGVEWSLDLPQPFAQSKIMTSATVAQLRFACRCFVKGRGKGSKGRGTGRGRGRGNNDKGNDKGGGGGPGRGSAGSAGSAGSGGSGTGTGGSSSSGSGGGSDNVGESNGGGNVGGGGGEETEESTGNPEGLETRLSPEEEEDYISHLMNALRSDASPGDESDSGSDGDDGDVSKVSGKLLKAVQEEEEMVAELELAHAERKTKTAGVYNKVVTIAAEQEINELQRGGAPAPDNAAELLVAVASGCQIPPSSDTGSNAGTGIGNASSSSSSSSSSSTTGGNAGNNAIDMWSKWSAACWNSFCSIAQMCHDMNVHHPHLVAHSVALVAIDSKSKKLGSTSSFELVYIDRLNLESERPEVTLRRIGSKLGKVHYLPASSQTKHPLQTVSVLVPDIGAHMVRPKLERQDVPQHIARVMDMLEVASDPQIAFGLNDACILCKRYVSSSEALAGVPSLSL
jgi:hypothetical protein